LPSFKDPFINLATKRTPTSHTHRHTDTQPQDMPSRYLDQNNQKNIHTTFECDNYFLGHDNHFLYNIFF